MMIFCISSVLAPVARSFVLKGFEHAKPPPQAQNSVQASCVPFRLSFHLYMVSLKPDQIEDVFRSMGCTICHVPWNKAYVCVICFPSIVDCIKRRWVSTDVVLCARSAKMIRLLGGKLHSFGATVGFPIFCAHCR